MALNDEREIRRQQLELRRALEAGRHSLENENFTAARGKFEHALDLEGDLGIPETGSQAHIALVETALKQGEYEERHRHLLEARHYYKECLELDFDNYEAEGRLAVINRKLWMRGIGIAIVAVIIIGAILAQLNNFIAWPVPVCDASGSVLCTPSPTMTNTPTPTATSTPTPTPTPTPYLIVLVVNKENTPVPVKEMGIREDGQETSICPEDCRREETAFSGTASQIGAYINLYTEENQMLVDEDSLPSVESSSDNDPGAESHYVEWSRWDTGEHTANFVVATMTPTPLPPTPTPMFASGATGYPNVFREPNRNELIGTLTQGQRVHICAKSGDYYLVALDYCHLVAPYGWVPGSQLKLVFVEEEFPPELITPTP